MQGLLPSRFDAKYTLSPIETLQYGGYYFFDGYTGSKIHMDPDLGKWKMVGLSDSSQFATTEADDYPFGTYIWKLNKNAKNITLNFNGCQDEWQFNCCDGSCIDITARWV